MIPAKVYFPALTGLRAVAALLVYAHHALTGTFPQTSLPGIIAKESHVGVTIFFVLSGFLIGTRYSASFSSFRGPEVKQYLLHRVARLYPLYLICTVLALLFRHDARLSSWVVNLTMTQGLFSNLAFSGIGVGWSLTSELCFYLAAPLLLLYWPRLQLLGSVAAILLLGALVAWAGNHTLSYHFLPDWEYFARMTFFGRCLEFCLGIWLARHLWRSSPPAGTSGPPAGIWTYGGSAGILAGMVFLNKLPQLISGWQVPAFHAVNNLLLPVFIVMLLWGLCQERTVLSRLLGSRLGQELGKGSFLFYLMHYTFGFDLLYFHVWPHRGGVLLLLAAVSVAGYYLVEVPAHQWVLRLGGFPLTRKTK